MLVVALASAVVALAGKGSLARKRKACSAVASTKG
jgi:hypothetical protein